MFHTYGIPEQRDSSISVNSTGTYSVTATDNFGFVSSDTVQVLYPTYTIGADTVFVCAGDSIELSVQDVPIGYGYLWNRTDTTPTLWAKAEGWNTLIVSDINGCKKS
ncbi:MAG: hypothetical protein IPO21_01315 [Bacteroidales bacterium]|nr:hypothetical protein [Bacteroidales bacterium]